uniref:Ig-like domain-containing protein n=1 Tax=Stegastes partitus TaxID=144197 RepID=A0A3B5AA56_9TELE
MVTFQTRCSCGVSSVVLFPCRCSSGGIPGSWIRGGKPKAGEVGQCKQCVHRYCRVKQNVVCQYVFVLVLDAAVLTTDPNWSTFFIGEYVTFICDMNEEEGDQWMYKINKDGQEYVVENTHQRYTLGRLSTHHSGDYECIGRRKSSKNTTNSNTVSLTVSGTSIYFIILFYYLLCDTAHIELLLLYNFEKWKLTTFFYFSSCYQEKIDNRVLSVSQGGVYQCRGGRGKPVFHTHLSDEVTVRITCEFISNEAVLTSRWPQIFSGERITLTCEIIGGETTTWVYEWRGTKSYIHWTANNYYMFKVSESGRDYMCRGRRKDDLYSLTEWSKAVSLSVSRKSPASLTVDPNTVQHFLSDSVSLSCGGNSSEGRVSMFTEDSVLQHCPGWRTMNGSTRIVHKIQYGKTVYWCESDSAFSNAVNITGQHFITDLSPVHPVTEGDSVTLGCKLRTENVLSDVLFYKNGERVQNDSRGEMSIPAVSKSDEGFYKCQYSEKESAQSWMAVKCTLEVMTVHSTVIFTCIYNVCTCIVALKVSHNLGT